MEPFVEQETASDYDLWTVTRGFPFGDSLMARPSSTHSSTGHAPGIGCGYLLKLTVGISALMIANSWLVGKVVDANMENVPDLFDDVRVYQFFQIFVPILLVCLQFWVYDRIRDAWIRRGQDDDERGDD